MVLFFSQQIASKRMLSTQFYIYPGEVPLTPFSVGGAKTQVFLYRTLLKND